MNLNEILKNSLYFGVLISLCSYGIGSWMKKKWKYSFLNPLLISIILTILFLTVFHIDYDTYYSGGKYLSYLLTPATIALAVPLYEQFELLKKNVAAVICGILAGVISSMTTILILSLLLRFDHTLYVTFLPKSITTAIGMGVSTELGGYASITTAVIILTGVIGNICASTVLKLFRITDPIAKGIGIGSSSHAIGTVRAMELGPVEGAMSSLSIVVSGLITVGFAPLFAKLL